MDPGTKSPIITLMGLSMGPTKGPSMELSMCSLQPKRILGHQHELSLGRNLPLSTRCTYLRRGVLQSPEGDTQSSGEVYRVARQRTPGFNGFPSLTVRLNVLPNPTGRLMLPHETRLLAGADARRPFKSNATNFHLLRIQIDEEVRWPGIKTNLNHEC